MNAEDNYRKIAIELESGQADSAIWAWALAESGGDADKTKALYVRRRFAALNVEKPAEVAAELSELQRLRVELRRQLALQRKQSLYSVLGVPADISDAALAIAIQRIIASDKPIEAETRYALEALGDAASREQFDRRLMNQLRQSKAMPEALLPIHQIDTSSTTSRAMRALTAVMLVLGIGYLGLGYTRDEAEREIRMKEVELRRLEAEQKAEIAARLLENQKTTIDNAAAAREKAGEAQAQAELNARMREDRQRLDMAYRQEQQAAQMEQRRQQAEQARLDAETRRREADAANAARLARQQAIQDAMARGNHNEAQRLRNQMY